jgi:hypothetical protein
MSPPLSFLFVLSPIPTQATILNTPTSRDVLNTEDHYHITTTEKCCDVAVLVSAERYIFSEIKEPAVLSLTISTPSK